MTEAAKRRRDRRGALTAALRYAAAGVLAVFGVGAVVKRRRLYDGRCVNRSVCRDCGLFERCGLPLALSSKRALTGGMAAPRLTGKMPAPQAFTGGMAAPQALAGKMPAPQAFTGGMAVPQALAGRMPAPQAFTGGMAVPQALAGKMPAPQAFAGKMPAPQALAGKMPAPQAFAGKMPAPREEGHRG
jgi:hypothetical protein